MRFCERVIHSITGHRAALILAVPLLFVARATTAELSFGNPVPLPGDAASVAAAGMQEDTRIARGGSRFLAVWADSHTSLDEYPPWGEGGNGVDVQGALLDATGNPIGGSFPIADHFGHQIDPRVAWDGTNWLVVWKVATPTLPTYERVEAVRVATDGTVLDADPIVIHDNQSYYTELDVEGGSSGWVVLFQGNGPAEGLFAVRVGADGTPEPFRTIHATNFLMDFALAFAGDEWLITWGGPFDTPRGRRYSSTLEPIGASFGLPFVESIATDGTDYLVVAATGSAPLAKVQAVRILHDGSMPAPAFTIFSAGNQAGTCCAGATWDGSVYWATWGQLYMARVTVDGQLLDPGGIQMALPQSYPISEPSFAGAPAGGLQLVWNSGVNGAAYPKDIYAGTVDSGAQLDNEIVISQSAPAQVDADFAEGDGTHLIVYRSRASESARLLAQRIDASGAALDPEPIEVATGPMPGIGVPSIGAPAAAWDGSRFLITWSDGLQVYARRLLADGTFVDATPLTVMDGFDPDVAGLDGVFVIVAIDFLLGNPQYQATHSMRVEGATGQNLDTEPNALGGFVIFAQHPHVVTFGNRWLAVWQTNISHDNSIADTKAAFIDPDGTTPGIINPNLGWRPDVAVSGDRALFVAVTGTISTASTDIAGQIMLADGTFIGDSFLITAAGDQQFDPTATWNGSEFVVGWADRRNAVIYFDERTDIYGTRITAGGTILDPAGVPILATPVPEFDPELVTLSGTTLLATSMLRPEQPYAAVRIGVQRDGATTGIGEATTSPPLTHLLGAFPNPANPATTIRFTTGASGPATLRIFDPAGRLVRTLFEKRWFEAGTVPTEVRWDGHDDGGHAVKSGVFLYRLSTASGAASDKLVILK